MNFVMNLYLYALLTKTLKRTATRMRVWAGSALGAACCVLLLFVPDLPVFIKRFAGPTAVSMAVTAWIFRIKQIPALCRAAGYLYVYAFAFGGIMKFLFSNVRLLHKVQGSIWYVLGAGMLGYQLVGWWLGELKKKKNVTICRVRICGNNNPKEKECGDKNKNQNKNEIWLDALVDTGNSLREPVSGKPVSVMDADMFERLEGVKLPEKLKLIPYRSIGRENGIMEGYEVPEIVIEHEGERIERQKAVVAVSKAKVSADGRYQIILHPELFYGKSGKTDRQE